MKRLKFFYSVLVIITVSVFSLATFATNKKTEKEIKVAWSQNDLQAIEQSVQVSPINHDVLTPLYFVHNANTAPTICNALAFGKITYRNKIPISESGKSCNNMLQ